MPYANIDFQGDWPDMLEAEVEDLILQYEGSAEDISPAGQWIAQHNRSPTGPVYTVGRIGRSGKGRLGPVVSTSRDELLDKLRRLLS